MTSASSPPAGLRLTRGPSPGAFTLRRRWARPKHVLFLAASAAIVAYLVPAWVRVAEGAAVASPLLVAGSIFGLGFVLRVLTAVVSWTKVTVGEREVLVEHGPLPSPVFRPIRVTRDAVRDFEARPWHGKYQVASVDAQGARTSLVHMLVTAAQADYVRDALRTAWSLPGGDVLPEPTGPAADAANAARAGTRGLALMPLVLVPAILALFYFMTSSEVEGSVNLTGDGAGAVFTPTDCRSGVPRGFFGVELTSEDAPGTVVRVVRDPTRGSMLAVERSGGSPEVFGPDRCATLDLNVQQTSTNVNDVWALRGSARAQCEGLTMDVRFDGCH